MITDEEVLKWLEIDQPRMDVLVKRSKSIYLSLSPYDYSDLLIILEKIVKAMPDLTVREALWVAYKFGGTAPVA